MGVVIKETIKTSIVNYLGIIIGAFNVLWLQTSILSEVEIGIIKYYFDLSILIIPFIMIGANNLSSRFLHRFKTHREENGFISFILLIPAFLFLIFISYFYLSIHYNLFIFTSENIDKEYIFPFILLVFANVYLYILEGILLALSKVFVFSILKNVIIRLLFTLLLVLYAYNLIDFYTLFVVYASLFLGEVIVLSLYIVKIRGFSFNLTFFSHPTKREIIKYSLFLVVGTGGVILMSKIDTLMIHEFLITGENVYGFIGVYAISFFIASIIEMPAKIMVQLLFPLMAKMATENKVQKLEEIYKKSAINGALISIFFLLLIWYNLDLLFGLIPNGVIYAGGKYVVLFIGMSKILDLFFGYSHGVLSATKYYRFSLFLFPVLLGMTVLFNYIFIPLYGIVGAALATALTISIYSFIRYVLVFKLLNMNSLTIKHFSLLAITMTVVIIFEIKPMLFQNQLVEIAFNSILLSLIYLSLISLTSVSEEFNGLLKNIKHRVFARNK